MATRKSKTKMPKTRKRRAAGGSVLPESPVSVDNMTDDVEVMLSGDGEPPMSNGDFSISVPLPDGSIEIDLNPQQDEPKDTKFGENLAEHLAESELSRISNDLLDGIEQDDEDRSEWLQTRADGMDLLGMKVEKPGGGGVGTSSVAVPGQSTVRDSLLAEACDQFQATSFAELCPSEGPCKGVNYGLETNEGDMLAEALEKDFNYYLTTIAKEYYPDTRHMLWWTGYASGMFKKVYMCPLRRRPVSESVDGADLIVPSNVTDLHNAGRITHVIEMRPAVMRRMQLLGVYRDIKLTAPVLEPNVLKEKTADISGMTAKQDRPEDQEYTVYECYCELDLPGFEHKEEGTSEPSGLPLPYRVTIDKDSRAILEIRRNWREEDEDQKAKIPFVAFPYATGIGFYGTGLLQRLGNYTIAITSMLRECIDAGMFASFPGFLYAKPSGRQTQNTFRVAPGGGAPVDVGMAGNIRDAIMPLPYKDVSTAMVQLMQQTRENAFRYGGMANTGVAEGKQDAPVGTTLAMIEQATKIEGGVHKALHAAQAEEMQLLKELFREDPESLWRGNRRPALGRSKEERLAQFTKALEDCEIVPASDPNVPSHMHRLAKLSTLVQLAGTAPDLFDLQQVMLRALSMMKVDDARQLLKQAPPGEQGPDPMMLAAAKKLDLEQQKVDNERMKIMITSQDKAADRASKETQEALRIANSLAVHPGSDQVVDQQMIQMAPLIKPAAPVAPGGIAPQQGAADGGPVTDTPDVAPVVESNPEHDETKEAVRFALDLVDMLNNQYPPAPKPVRPPVSSNRWWDNPIGPLQ